MASPYYPDDISGPAICHIEGCVGKGPCPRCGKTNYALMGYYGAVARWAKKWGVSEDDAERLMGLPREVQREDSDERRRDD